MRYVYPIYFDAALTVDGGSITNSYLLNNGAIDFAASISDNDRVRFNFAAYQSVNPNYVAIYVNSGSGNAVVKRTTGKITVSTTALSTGWNVIAISSTTSSNWYVEFTGTSSLEVSEVFFAYGFEFPYNYDLQNTERSVFGVDLTTSEGGIEFANKRHEEIVLKNWDWRNFSETDKTNYKAMLTTIGCFWLKILWFDDSAYNWIRFQAPPMFTEAGYQAHDTQGSTRSQLA